VASKYTATSAEVRPVLLPLQGFVFSVAPQRSLRHLEVLFDRCRVIDLRGEAKGRFHYVGSYNPREGGMQLDHRDVAEPKDLKLAHSKLSCQDRSSSKLQIHCPPPHKR